MAALASAKTPRSIVEPLAAKTLLYMRSSASCRSRPNIEARMYAATSPGPGGGMPRASRLLTSSSVAAMMTAPVPVTAKVLTCSGGSRRSQKEEEEEEGVVTR